MIESRSGSIARVACQHKSHESESNNCEEFEKDQRETEVIAYSAGTESTVTFIKTGASLYIIIKGWIGRMLWTCHIPFKAEDCGVFSPPQSRYLENNAKSPVVRAYSSISVQAVPTSQDV